jgi:hypothetical protein
MKKWLCALVLLFCTAILFAGGKKENTKKTNGQTAPVGDTVLVQPNNDFSLNDAVAKKNAALNELDRQLYKQDLTLPSLAIWETAGEGLNANEEWMLSTTQERLSDIFTKHTKFVICDLLSIKNIEKAQQLTIDYGHLFSEDTFLPVGHIENFKNILFSGIKKYNDKYELKLYLNDAEKNIRYASAIIPFQIGESGKHEPLIAAIKKGALTIFEDLETNHPEFGVKLTDTQKATLQLSDSANARKIAIEAEEKGNFFGALKAAMETGDSSIDLQESLIDKNHSVIQGIIDDKEKRERWIKWLNECADDFQTSEPYSIVYDPNLTLIGKPNYKNDNDTVNFCIQVAIEPSIPQFKAINKLLEILEQTGKKTDWGFDDWPLETKNTSIRSVFGDNTSKVYDIQIELRNQNRIPIARSSVSITRQKIFFDHNSILIPSVISKTVSFDNVKINSLTNAVFVEIIGINGEMYDPIARNNKIEIIKDSSLYDKEMTISGIEKYISINRGEASITGYGGNTKNIIIQEMIKNVPVTTIGEKAFESKSLSKVTLPNSLKSIKDRSFYSNNITTVTIPSSVKEIGKWAFSKNAISELSFLNGIESIGEGAFQRNNLRNVILPNSVITINRFAFQGNPNLKTIHIVSNVNVDPDAFDYGFANAYLENSRSNGTYTLINGKWQKTS